METQSLFGIMQDLKKSDFNSFDHSDADIHYSDAIVKNDKKQKLSELLLDTIDSYSEELTGKEICDSLKLGIEKAYNHSKKEYEKFKYIARELGIE
jgi:hypothetical protein|tara:strand:+ start:118 stop:405 length:288 start_codon:yes stop_codon:yes gene_type:complete